MRLSQVSSFASTKLKRSTSDLHSRSSRTSVDEPATHQFLKDLLCNKNSAENSFEEDVDRPRLRLGSHGQHFAHRGKDAGKALSESTAAPVSTVCPLGLESEQRAFINQVCSDNSRYEVREWVGKVFSMTHHLQAVQHPKDRRRKRLVSAQSDSGLSGQTGYTGTTGTALHTVGGSIVAPNYRPKSVESDESLVVHDGKADAPLSLKERAEAFAAGRIPELAEHVEAVILQHTEELKNEVDEETAQSFLRSAADRRIFDEEANLLRWQNARQQALQRRLDANMASWTLKGLESWEQRPQAAEAPKSRRDVSEADLIFDYLTKRAAHIDSGKLPSQIPVFKTLRTSYSMPKMWRDKYKE